MEEIGAALAQSAFQGTQHHSKSGFAKAFERKVTHITIELVKANSLIGRLSFMGLIIIEHLFLVFLIMINTQPSIKGIQLQYSQDSYIDIINMADSHLFTLRSTESVPLIAFGICITIFAVCILMGAILVGHFLVPSSGVHKFKAHQGEGADQSESIEGGPVIHKHHEAEEEDSSFPNQLLSAWLGLHRRILTYLITYAILQSALMIARIESQNNIADSAAGIESSFTNSTNEYILIIMMALGSLSFILTYLMSMLVMRLPIKVKDLPWNSSYSRVLQLRELFKAFIMTSDYFVSAIGISDNHITHSIYQLMLVLALLGLLIYRPPHYFDTGVDRIHKISLRLTLCASIISLFRVAFIVQQHMILIYTPIMGFATVRFFDWYDSKQSKSGLKRLLMSGFAKTHTGKGVSTLSKKNTPDESFHVVQQLFQLLDKLKGNDGRRSTAQLKDITIEDEQLLGYIHESHKLNCFHPQCICRHEYFITCELFKEEELSLQAKIEAEKNEERAALLRHRGSGSKIQGTDYRSQMYSHNGTTVEGNHLFKTSTTKIPDRLPQFGAGSSTQIQGSGFIASARVNHFQSTPPPPHHPDLNDPDPFQQQQQFHPIDHQTFVEAGQAFADEQRSEMLLMPSMTRVGSKPGNSGEFWLGSSTQLGVTLNRLPTSSNIQSCSILRVEDVFTRGGLAQLIKQQKIEDKHNMLLLSADDFPDKESFRAAVKQRSFKTKKDAKSYYYTTLIGTILENYALLLQNTSHSQGSHQSENTWLEYRLLYIQFISCFLNRPFLAIHNLLQLDYQSAYRMQKQSSLSTLGRVQLKVCEQLLMRDILQNINNFQDKTQQALRISDYIERSNYIKKLDQFYDATARDILDFWRQWNSTEPQLRGIFIKGREIARAIQTIKIMTAKVEEDTLYLVDDVNRYSLRMHFHGELLNDPWTAQHMHVALKNRLLFNAQKKPAASAEASQLIGNFSETIASVAAVPMHHSDQLLSEQGICVVSVRQGEGAPLEFLYVNKAFSKLLGLEEQQLLEGKNIKLVMPEFVRMHHDAFIARFFAKGSPKVLGRQRIVFIKDIHGHILPVKFKLEFSYDRSFRYAFIGSFEAIRTLNAGAGEERKQIPVQDALIFLTDEDNTISEVSENVLIHAGFEGSLDLWKSAQDARGKPFCLDQLVSELPDIISQQQRVAANIIESAQLAQSPSLGKFSLLNQIVKFKRFSRATDEFSELDYFPAVLTCIEEVYTGGAHHLLPGESTLKHAKQRIFIIVPLVRHPESENLLRLNTSDSFQVDVLQNTTMHFPAIETSRLAQKEQLRLDEKRYFSRRYPQKTKLDLSSILVNRQTRESQQLDGEGDDDTKDKNSENDSSNANLDMSSQSSQGYSQNSGGPDAATFHKNLFFKQRTPRILMLCLTILCVMLLAFFIVSIYNLMVFILKHGDIKSRIETFNLSTRRNLDYRGLLLDLQTIHQLSYYYSTNQTQNSTLNNFKDVARIDYYGKMYLSHLEKARELTQIVDMNNVKSKADQGYDQILLPTLFLSEEGLPYTKNSTFKNQNNLLLTYMEMLDLKLMRSEKPILNVSDFPNKIMKQKSTGVGIGRATETERELYFIFMNALTKMEEQAYIQAEKTFMASRQQSQSSRETLKLSSEVSVIIVTCILLGIIPLFVNLQNRMYSLVHFLFYLNQAQVDAAVIRCQEYQHRLKEINNSALLAHQKQFMSSLQEEEDNFKGSVTSNHPFAKLNNDQQQHNAESNHYIACDSKYGIQHSTVTLGPGPLQHHNKDNHHIKFKMQDKNASFPVTLSDINDIDKKNIQILRNSKRSSKRSSQTPMKEKKKMKKLKKSFGTSGHKNKEEIPIEEEKEEEDEEEQSESHEASPSKKQTSQTAQVDIVEHTHASKQNYVNAQVSRQSWREKIRIVASLLVLIAYLNSFILISEYFGGRVFSDNEDSQDYIKVYFERENCAYDLLLFTKNQLITNHTDASRYHFDEDTDEEQSQGISEYLENCLKVENQLSMTKNALPTYFSEASQILEYQESEKLCNSTFIRANADDIQKAQECSKFLDGILSNGIDAGMNLLFSMLTQLNINFESHPKRRTAEYLESTLNSQKLQDLVDLAIIYMRESFIYAQSAVIDSLKKFFDRQKLYYLLIFSIYTTVTVVFSIFLGLMLFKKVKRRILEIQNILVLLPLMELQAKERATIEKYLSS